MAIINIYRHGNQQCTVQRVTIHIPVVPFITVIIVVRQRTRNPRNARGSIRKQSGGERMPSAPSSRRACIYISIQQLFSCACVAIGFLAQTCQNYTTIIQNNTEKPGKQEYLYSQQCMPRDLLRNPAVTLMMAYNHDIIIV